MRCLATIGFLIVAAAWAGPSACAQFRPRFMIAPDSQVTAEIDRRVQQAMDEAQHFIGQKQFGPAVTRLQSILDHPEDFFLEKDFKAKIVPRRGVKAQTLRILANLPAEGRAAYELHAGATARGLLKEALSTNDLDKLSRVASHYQMTAAGFEALQSLAASAFDHDQPLEAALLCDAMRGHPRAIGALKGPLLLQSAYAWYLAGQTERSVSALIALDLASASVPWRIGGHGIPALKDMGDAPEWLQAQFGSPLRPHLPIANEWKLPRGGLTGNESATATCPVGGGAWAISSLAYSQFLLNDESNRQRIEAFDRMVRQIERTMRDDNRLTQPASAPVIVGDVVVYRTLNDVTAVSLRTGQLLWRSSMTDGMLAWLFQSPIATSESVPSASLLTFRGYLRFKLFRDQLSGSLTSDGSRVFAIEESDSQFSPLVTRGRQQFGAPSMADPTNKLVAYELMGGRLLWEIGGPSGTPPAELSGLFFLGPPLPFADRLYCLAESKNELRLLSLIPEATSARLEWSQALVATDRNQFATLRRMAGVMPVIADGIIVCPTANGSIVAFDIVQRQLRWGYSYESLSSRNIQDGVESIIDEEKGRWLDGGPVLSNGRVLVTPRDSTELHCLNLVDGTLHWKRPIENGLYVACVNDDDVIVIERTQVVAYSMLDGSMTWTEPTEIPEPSGHGVRVGSQYLLPLSTGEIATIDLPTGRILGRSSLPDGRVPGNLAVGAGALVSRGVHEIVGFRPLDEIEQQIGRQLMANPDDAEALALRGEVRLHRGQEDEAIDDLRRSLQRQPQPRVRRVLAETLLNHLRNDPRRLLESSAELETLTDADPRQKIEFLRLYARSLNETGNSVGAIAQLFRLAATLQIPDEMIAAGPEHFISLQQSVRSQLFTIYEEANSIDRNGIAGAFEKEFEDSSVSTDRALRLTRLISLTVGHPAAELLLLRLTESKDELPDENSRTQLLERLSKSGRKTVAATSIAILAQRLLAANAPHEARPWIEVLAREFPSEVCREGRTGRQLSDEWLARDDVRQSKTVDIDWPEGPIAVERTGQSAAQATFTVDIVTHVGHDFVGWSFETDVLGATLTARDPSLRVAWRLPLVNFSDDLRMQPSQLHIRGRRLAFSSGMRLAVMEATTLEIAPRILFEQSLRPDSPVAFRAFGIPVERRLLPNGRRFQLMSDARGLAGFLVGLADDAVFYQLDNRLYAAHPETGRILWSRIGPQFAKSDATVDQTLVLNTSDNGALLVRTLDGELQQRHRGNRDEIPLWFRGTRRLSQRSVEPDQRVFEMRDFDGDHIVWQSQHPPGSLTTVVEGEDLAILEPSGKLTVLDLATGELRLTTELHVKRPLGGTGVMSVQRCDDRYLIVAGVSSKPSNTRRVMPLDFGSPREFGSSSIATFTVDGHVSAIDRINGHVLWSVPVVELAFDPAQSPRLPVVVLASIDSINASTSSSDRKSSS